MYVRNYVFKFPMSYQKLIHIMFYGIYKIYAMIIWFI